MAKITKVHELLQEAEYSNKQIVIRARQGKFEKNNGEKQVWVNLDCVDELVYVNASSLGIDVEDLPTVTVKIKNPDTRDWEQIVGEVISTSSAVVVPVIKNNQLTGLALSVESTDL